MHSFAFETHESGLLHNYTPMNNRRKFFPQSGHELSGLSGMDGIPGRWSRLELKWIMSGAKLVMKSARYP